MTIFSRGGQETGIPESGGAFHFRECISWHGLHFCTGSCFDCVRRILNICDGFALAQLTLFLNLSRKYRGLPQTVFERCIMKGWLRRRSGGKANHDTTFGFPPKEADPLQSFGTGVRFFGEREAVAWELNEIFIRLFLKPADNYRWSRESIVYPRLKDGGKRCIYPENRIEDIERGFREIGYTPSKSNEPQLFRTSLNPLKDTLRKVKRSETERQRIIKKYGRCGTHRQIVVPDTYNRVKSNLCGGNHWLFTQYPEQIEFLAGAMEENTVQFDIWDFDVHIDETDTDKQVHEKYLKMHAQIDHAQRMSVRYGFTITFFTSPGDLINGAHHQGRYGLVIFDAPISVSTLIQTRKQVKTLLGIDWETAWDSRHRNLRLLGQDHVVLCDPDTLDPVYRNDNAQQRHQRVADAIQAVIEDEALVQMRQIIDKAAQQLQAVSVDSKDVASPASFTITPAITLGVTAPGLVDIESCREEPDTFRVFTSSRKIGHRAAMKYLLKNASMSRSVFINKAIDDFKEEFVSSRPSTSRSARNAGERLRGLFAYYFDTFDPKKLNGDSRAVRYHEDRERIEDCLDLDEQLVACTAQKKLDLTRREASWFVTIYRYLNRCNGRLSWKLLYGPGGIVPKRKWNNFMKKIKSALGWIVDYQPPEGQQHGTCRQWSLTRAFVACVKHVKTMKATAKEIMRRVQQYKTVAVHLVRTITPRGPYRFQLLENQEWIEPIALNKRDKLLKRVA